MSVNYHKTKITCYIASFGQAVAINLSPLLFVVFQDNFSLSYEKLGRLILINFITQLIIDILCVKYADRIGYRIIGVAAHLFSSIGLACFGIFPLIMPPYAGLIIATIIFSIGSGAVEVVTSPVLEALPSKNKAGEMSFLHSFYAWGQIIVTLVTTLIIKLSGYDFWFLIPIGWAVIPFINAINFSRVPLLPIVPENEEKTSLTKLLKNTTFLLALVAMICAGAAELTMSQWASLFAEKGLGVNKFMGDLLGPCLFAAFMCLGRTIYGKFSHKFRLERLMILCSVSCLICYIITVFSPFAVASLFGCALCGLTVSIMWPGTLSLSAKRFRNAGTAMFGMLSVFGDIGCSIGPWISGIISDNVQKSDMLLNFGNSFNISPEQLGIKFGILSGVIAPLVLLICTLAINKKGEINHNN